MRPWFQRPSCLWLLAAWISGLAAITTSSGRAADSEAVVLTPEARSNLGLEVRPLEVTSYWKVIEIPGVVVDRPGISDRGVTAPIAGTITTVHAFPGMTVAPNAPLFTIRLVSDPVHKSQLELFKAMKEIEIARRQLKRLEDLAQSGALAQTRIFEIENQLDRMQATVEAYRQDLVARGLSPQSIDDAATGQFVTEIVVRAPAEAATTIAPMATTDTTPPPLSPPGQDALPFAFEVHSLDVELGQHVEAGMVLMHLADHRRLLVEGRGFKDDMPLVQEAARRDFGVVGAPLVRLSMAVPGLLLVASWLAMAWAGFELSRLGRNFLPQFDEGSIQVNVSLPPGSSLAASSGVTRTIDAQLAVLRRSETNPTGEILSFVRRTGRAELDEHAMPVSSSEYILAMNPDTVRDRDAVLADLLSTLRRQVPGVDIEVEQPLAHLISHMISGVYAQIAIKVHGDDLDELLAIAGRIKQSLGGVAGLTPPVIEPIREADELHIRLKPEELARHGLTRQAVADVMQTALQGRVVSQVLEGQRRFDLLVRLEDRARNDFANLGRLRIELPGGQGQVELGTLAELGDGVGPSSVNRENARRRIVIRCNTQGRDLAGAVAEIRRTLDKSLQLPEGYFLEYGGQFESQARATAMLGGLAAVSVVGMYLVLLALFPSHRLVLQILNALPTAFVGGVAALVLTGQSLSVASLVGFISLGGIAVRNGILLVTHYVHLMQEEGEPFSRDLVMRGSLERLAPVLMTALTAGIGLVPLVVAGLEPGREILYPVATVILGGLVTSTFCEFLIHPGLFWRFSGRDADRLLEKPGSPALEPALQPKASIAPGGVGRWTDT